MGYVILGIDPGLAIGLAALKIEDGKITRSSRMTAQYGSQFNQFLHDFIIPKDDEFVVVCEEFFLLEHKAVNVSRNRGSRGLEASKVIGAVEYWTDTGGHKLVMQSPALNPSNAKASGVPIPKDHSKSHDVIAYNHAHHYALQANLIKHRLLSE